jgi:hypothetical protein
MPKVTVKNDNKIAYQIIGLIVVLMVLIAISTLATLAVTGKVELAIKTGAPISHINEAESACSNRIKQDHLGNINSIALDDRSSRYDQASGQFKLFYHVEIYRNGNKQSGVSHFYTNCFVSSDDGMVWRIEYLEELDFKAKPIKREQGNPFGF